MKEKAIKLKTVFLINNFILGTLAIVAAGSLVAITSFLHEASLSSERSIESLRVTEEFKVSLLAHNRLALLQTVDPSIDYSKKLLAVQAGLNESMKDLDSFVDDAAERSLVERVKTSTHSYFLSASIKNRLPAPRVKNHIRAVDELDEAYAAIEELTGLNLQQIRNLREQIRKYDSAADILALSAVMTMAVGIFIIIWILRSSFYSPLIAFRGQIARFGKGEFKARVQVEGVVELKEVAETFNQLADNLSHARKTQLHFLASVAHDLKNPMGAITMASEILAETGFTKPAEAKPLISIITRQTKHLERLVTDLLDTTRAEAGEIQLLLSKCDLREVAQEAVCLYKNVSSIHQIKFTAPSTPVLCDCDPTRISQVLNNILSNAIKYSPHGGQVVVAVTVSGDHGFVSVIDQGIGVATEEQEQIFVPFNRASTTKDTIPGVGLGLSFARRIARAHGGSIEIKSELNVGSTFVLMLPCLDQSRSSLQV